MSVRIPATDLSSAVVEEGPVPPALPSLRSDKITARHLERLAMVYIRQSTPQQLIRHQESKEVQYQLRFRAEQLGWPRERVEVIDDDLGKSGTSVQGRPGFQRLVTEVSLDHVGIIFGAEMSRLARSCRDWYQLLDVCAVFGTLIADLDGVYDPSQYNDRLLLGLKGTMSEAELHILKQRMLQGKLNKARKGELLFSLPIGYVRRANGQVGLDPDEQVQGVVRLIFEKYQELGTLNATLLYLVQHHLQLGVRLRGGERKGELEWHRPNRVTLQNLLKHPIYAGAYVYGRRQVDAKRKIAGRPSTGRMVVPAAQCQVLLKDRFPAYISWAQYEQNQQQLRANRSVADQQGAVRYGSALLSGLLVCSHCGQRMTVHYTAASGRHRYACDRLRGDYGEALCQSLAGPPVDEVVAQRVLEALQPAALEVSLEAARHVEQERAQVDTCWQQRLERARYESARAARQYRLVEPENRLVARQLEREWEEKLAEQRRLEDDYDRVAQQQPRLLSDAEREAIRQLAADLPALWHDARTTPAERKEILRQVIEKIRLEVIGDTERVRLEIHWAGGRHSPWEMTRPVARLEQLSYYPQLCDRLRQLAAQDLDPRQIARQLNHEGWCPPKRRRQFAHQGIAQLLRRLNLRPQRGRGPEPPTLGQHEWWLADLARALDMPGVTLYNWLCRGLVKGYRHPEGAHHWVLWADEAELARLRQRRVEPAGRPHHHRWLEKVKAQQ
jgi:DNA invertase Pin-like site-specific DNA recombinase